MSFWDEYGKAQAERAEKERAEAPPTSQNAPAVCAECGHEGTDVYFGTCLSCSESWEDVRDTPRQTDN